jgi:hypothetical protein
VQYFMIHSDGSVEGIPVQSSSGFNPFSAQTLTPQQIQSALVATAAWESDSQNAAAAAAVNDTESANYYKLQVQIDIDRYTAATTPNGSGAPIVIQSPPMQIPTPSVTVGDQPSTVDIPSD